MYDAIGRRNWKASTLISIGQVYFAQKNHKLAIEYYEKARLLRFEDSRINRGIADTLEELASVYYDQESYDRALGVVFEVSRGSAKPSPVKPRSPRRSTASGTLISNSTSLMRRFRIIEKALAGFEELNNSSSNAPERIPMRWSSTLSNIASASTPRLI